MPVDVVHIRTEEADVSQSVITELYASDRPIRFSSAAGPFVADLRFVTAGDLGADRVLCSAAAQSCVVEPVDYLMVVSPLHGQQVFRAGRDEVVLLPGDAARYPTDTAALVDWEHFDVATIRLPLEQVHRVAEEHGLSADGPLRFTGLQPTTGATRSQWLRTMRFVHGQLAEPDGPGASPLVLDQLVDLVAAAALTTFPNTSLTSRHRPRPRPVGPATLRRAVAHIDEHAHERLTVSDIAAAAGTTARALQYAFRRHHGTTPLGYLRRVRLDNAHLELLATDPTQGRTVRDVAARWGFRDTHRFAATYRATFATDPGETLRS